jgi:hypothetical protein
VQDARGVRIIFALCRRQTRLTGVAPEAAIEPRIEVEVVKKADDVHRRWFHAAAPFVVDLAFILMDIAVHHFDGSQLFPPVYPFTDAILSGVRCGRCRHHFHARPEVAARAKLPAM